jgi:Flp pilus assembly pilin Flp
MKTLVEFVVIAVLVAFVVLWVGSTQSGCAAASFDPVTHTLIAPSCDSGDHF